MIRKIVAELYRKYNYVGYKRDVFRENRELIREINLTTLYRVSFLGMLISLVLWITSYGIDFSSQNLYAYILICVTNACFYALAKLALREQVIGGRALVYSWYLLVFIYCIYMGCYVHRDVNATAFCVFLVALPLFFVDKPLYANIMQIIVSILFIWTSKDLKGTYYFGIDRLNCMTFLVVGIALNYIKTYGKVREIIGREILKKEKNTDPLTELQNRGGIEQCIEKYISSNNKKAAMILVDIDNFKNINDEFGHHAGDDILCESANIMREKFRETDQIGRLGGDEFVIFVPNINSKQWLCNRLDDLIESLERTLIGDSGIQKVSASMGVVIFPEDGSDYDELYRNADKAMYCAKRNGKSAYSFYEK